MIEKPLRARAEVGLLKIPVTRATSPAPVADHGGIAVPDLLTTRQWNVTIGCQVEEVTDDPRFPALFEVALTSDPEVPMIQFGVPSLPHCATVVLIISAAERNTADVLGLNVLKRNLHVAAQTIVGDKPYGRAIRVGVEPFPSPPH
jgi:hypothetical protein